MRTGITSLAEALFSASVVMTAAIICAGAGSADPNQQDQFFVAQLEADQIPVVDNLPALVARAHQICGELDGGASVYTLVDEEMNIIFAQDPAYHQESARVHRTAIRFIAVSAQAYCPSHLADPYVSNDVGFSVLWPALPCRVVWHPGCVSASAHESIATRSWQRRGAVMQNAVNSANDLRETPSALDMINMPAPWQESTGTGASRLSHLTDSLVVVAGRSGDHRSVCDAHATVLASLIEAVPSGDITQPDPPQIPPPPPTAQIQAPPRPIAVPPRPKQPPPPPQKPPPPPQQPPPQPQQMEPPAVGPQPGGAAGSGGGDSTGGNGGSGNGSGNTGGGGPAEPSPAPPMPPGLVRLAP